MAATAAAYSRVNNVSMGVAGNGSGGIGGHNNQLSRSVERILEEASLSGELILTNRKLKEFPKIESKCDLTDTVIADLSRNRFTELPEELTTFPFVETLLLYHNTIRSIPESVKQWTSLTYLDLRNNQLSILPKELCLLPLQVLLVSNNRLCSLPDELGRMEKLSDLDVSYNQLTSLPTRIGELHALRWLSLRSNQLVYLPRELTCLSLVTLDISNNRISSLPFEIRHMHTLIELHLENNPLTSPPANLCVRGIVHIFKHLEIQATKDDKDKGIRSGSSYDGYTTLRRTPRSIGGLVDTNQLPRRNNIDSGYSTCDGLEKRWSHDLPGKTNGDCNQRLTPTPISTPTSSCASVLFDGDNMSASLSSNTSTLVDDSPIITAAIVKPLNLESTNATNEVNLQHKRKLELSTQLNYSHSSSSSSNTSTPEIAEQALDVQMPHQNGTVPHERTNRNLESIQTYKEYKEALKQQRSHEIYKLKDHKHHLNSNEQHSGNATNQSQSNVEHAVSLNTDNIPKSVNVPNLPKSIIKNSVCNSNGSSSCSSSSNMNGVSDDGASIPKKPVQKVIPSRNTELMSIAVKNHTNDLLSNDKSSTPSLTNGDCGEYLKPSSPLKTPNGTSLDTMAGISIGMLTNNNKFIANNATKVLIANSMKVNSSKPIRSVTWQNDVVSEKLSFTMRREFDRQREETELMTQLRRIIESRLKMTLPDDLASALTDGVILCHLANYVRPRSVASIHVPSPGVSKLTMARCRRNVDNFLEACRKIGVDEELICSCTDIIPTATASQSDVEHCEHDRDVVDSHQYSCNTQQYTIPGIHKAAAAESENQNHLPNALAVLKTVAALLSMDGNSHHQNLKYLEQQYEFEVNLQLFEKKILVPDQCKRLPGIILNESSAGAACLNEPNIAGREQTQSTATCTKMKEQMLLLPTNPEHFSQYNSLEEITHNQTLNIRQHNDSNSNLFILQTASRQKKVLQKSFENVKYNLNTAHGNSGNIASNDHNHVASIGMMGNKTFLKAIAETEKESEIPTAATTANNFTNTATISATIRTTPTTPSIDVCSNKEVYHIIDEKSNSMQNELSLQVNQCESLECLSQFVNNNFKILEMPMREKICEKQQLISNSGTNSVSKRIEFFEHANIPNGGIIKPKPDGIYSIYRNNDSVNLEADKTQLPKNNFAKMKLFFNSFNIRHDSHILTMILSAIFILTFVLLLIFPLPA